MTAPTMPADAAEIVRLAERVEQATGPDRDLDAEIQEKVFGWQPHRIPADAFGENACDVLTPGGEAMKVDGHFFVYPPKGAVHRAYHCPAWTRDCIDPAFPRAAVRQQTVDLLRARAASALSDGEG